MRVESSQLAYEATHRLVTRHTTVERTVNLTRNTALGADTVSLSQSSSASGLPSDREDLQDLDPKQQVAILALEAILGHRFQWRRGQAVGAGRGNAQPVAVKSGNAAPAAAAPSETPAVRIRQVTETHAESERTTFQAAGSVQTSDGRSIVFEASLEMRREYYSQTTSTAIAPVATDPLMVNFGGGAARLTNAKISFDLNADGTAEQISFAANGSGFLALDKNNDGRINDGTELFGPQSGNGFGELAAYDADANGWIDEADPVYAQLKVWSQSGLQSLADHGVGAISTAAVETPFALKNAANELLGEIRATSVVLNEDGSARTIQQVDLVG